MGLAAAGVATGREGNGAVGTSPKGAGAAAPVGTAITALSAGAGAVGGLLGAALVAPLGPNVAELDGALAAAA